MKLSVKCEMKCILSIRDKSNELKDIWLWFDIVYVRKMSESKSGGDRVLRDGCSISNLNSTYIRGLLRRIFTDNKIRVTIN